MFHSTFSLLPHPVLRWNGQKGLEREQGSRKIENSQRSTFIEFHPTLAWAMGENFQLLFWIVHSNFELAHSANLLVYRTVHFLRVGKKSHGPSIFSSRAGSLCSPNKLHRDGGKQKWSKILIVFYDLWFLSSLNHFVSFMPSYDLWNKCSDQL